MTARMSITKFYKELNQITKNNKIQWRINKSGMIRCSQGYCPILVIGRIKGIRSNATINSFYKIGIALGLSFAAIEKIIDAADSPTESLKFFKEKKSLLVYRRNLLKATGLLERKR